MERVPAPGPEVAPRAASETSPHRGMLTITAQDMAREIGVMAHDSMAGRDTPSPELEATAAYIAQRFRSMGLEPAGENGTYIDRFEWIRSWLSEAGTAVRIQDAADPGLEYAKDFFLVPGQTPVTAEAVYIGTAGVDSPGADHKGTVVLFDHPGTEPNTEWQQKLGMAVGSAMMAGAGGVVLIMDPALSPDVIPQIAGPIAGQRAPIPVLGISSAGAERIFEAAGHNLEAIRSAEGPTSLDANLEISWEMNSETVTPPNVVAMLPGSDPALRDTYVVLTAHFDHVGVGAPDATGDSIFNGADDNASGTAGVLEVAEAFASLPVAPARSLVFLAVSGEEKGLLGSSAYAEDPPVIDIERVVANVNLDMIGRLSPDTIIGIGQEYSTIQGVIREIQEDHPELGLAVILDPVPEERFFFRSDQLPFIRKGIPAVFFTTPEHEDYHKPSDEAARIDTDKAARVARLTFLLAYEIAQDPTAPEWTEEGWAQVEELLGQGGS